jgi:O-antigen/teichoic acid export membrane protein
MNAHHRAGERSFAANALASILGWFVSTLAGFIALPIVVRGLGADAYGLWVLVAAFTGYLGMLDMGLGQTVIRYISFYRERGCGATVLAITRRAIAWFTGAGVVGALVMLVSAPWLVGSVLKVPVSLQQTGVLVIRLSAASFVLGMLMSLASAIPQAFLRFDISGLFTGIWGTAASVGPAVLVSLGYGLVAIVVYSIVLNVVALVVYAIFIARLFGGLALDQGPPWKEVRRQVFSFAGVTAVTRLHTAIAQQTNRIVVGIADGTAAAAYYQVPSVLSSGLTSMMNQVAQVLFPTGSRLFARDDRDAVRALYYRTSRLFFLVNAAVVTGMSVFAHQIVEYWVSPEFADKGDLVLVVFAATVMLNSASMAASYLNLSAARPGVNLVFALFNSAISLSCVYPLTVRYGALGAATAGLLGAIAVPFFLVFTQRRVLRLSSIGVLRHCYLPTIVGSAVSGAGAHFGLVPLANSLAATLALLAATVLAGVLLSGVLGAVSREDLAAGRRLLSSIRSKLMRR